MDNSNSENTQKLEERLERFLKINPSAKLEYEKDRALITHPWDDDTVAFEITSDNQGLIDALNNLLFPPHLSAIYHTDSSVFEFIYKVKLEDDPLWSRSFEFTFEGVTYPCKYSLSSERLIHIARVAQLRQVPSSTDYRNLKVYRDFCDPTKISPAAIRYFEKRKPVSFFFGPVKIENTDQMIELARHLNFYMFYFDRDTPQIIIHRPEDVAASFSEAPAGVTFPDSIIGSRVDTYMLDLWTGAQGVSGRLAFLYFYQMLEYAAFYYIDEQVKSRVGKILRRPEILSSMETCLSLVVDEIVEYRQSDEHKLAAVVQKSVDPEKVWFVIEKYVDYFANSQSFDGGFAVDALIKDNWTASDFAAAWTPKLPDRLRKIRNALVHSRESRVGQVIAPTRANSAKLMPWVKVIEEIACQVAIYRNV